MRVADQWACSLTFSGSFHKLSSPGRFEGCADALPDGGTIGSTLTTAHCVSRPNARRLQGQGGAVPELLTFLKLTDFVTTAGQEQKPAEGGCLEMQMLCGGTDQPSG
jgi:hypothetical protein